MSLHHPSAVVFPRDEQRRGGSRPTSQVRYVAVGGMTGGDFGLFESGLGPGGSGPGPHYHQGFSESFYVLQGRLSVLSGDDRITVGPGELVYVPRYGIHGFSNASDEEDTRFLILFTPGAPREEYFDAMASLRANGYQPSIAEVDEVARRFDQINIRD